MKNNTYEKHGSSLITLKNLKNNLNIILSLRKEQWEIAGKKCL
ncbi:MAG: hypothetical protein ACQPRH_05925 [Solitalea-like symbiont of Tyrophagus putrescentiae]